MVVSREIELIRIVYNAAGPTPHPHVVVYDAML